MVAELEHPWAMKRECPDGATCHHQCRDSGCWRVSFCAPLSSYGDDWTDEDRAANQNPPTTIESVIVLSKDDDV